MVEMCQRVDDVTSNALFVFFVDKERLNKTAPCGAPNVEAQRYFLCMNIAGRAIMKPENAANTSLHFFYVSM